MQNLAEKEDKEISFWKNAHYENPGNFSLDNFFNKMHEAFIFFQKYNQYQNYFKESKIIFEIGAGQCWSACIIKKILPNHHIFSSDISPFAVESAKHWEKVFDVSLDKVVSCRSYELPFESNSVDLIYCFASAHHFVKHKESLQEIYRVLKPKGKCIYFFEPTCHKFFYETAKKRVNKKRPIVPEDLLLTTDMLKFGKEIGYTKSIVNFDPSTINRGVFETIYYFTLSKIKFLQRYLPCTADFIFEK